MMPLADSNTIPAQLKPDFTFHFSAQIYPMQSVPCMEINGLQIAERIGISIRKTLGPVSNYRKPREKQVIVR